MSLLVEHERLCRKLLLLAHGKFRRKGRKDAVHLPDLKCKRTFDKRMRTSGSSRTAATHHLKMLHDARMAGSVKPRCSVA
ncbi:hypothetical protein [Roseobacter sp. GAI101]|uniref:hypothetical protein n=1 Tax=Roseobacter sp. (strain GAI101) TaxID=391589 RepID=UPI0012ED3B21|nr:hypothetical protein [Roseobacter sp. GAI101]